MQNSDGYYYIVRDFQIENVGLIFFSKLNIEEIQKKIKQQLKTNKNGA